MTKASLWPSDKLAFVAGSAWLLWALDAFWNGSISSANDPYRAWITLIVAAIFLHRAYRPHRGGPEQVSPERT